MRKVILALLFCTPALLAQNNLTGDWVLSTDIFGSALQQKLVLKVEGSKVTGELAGNKLEGSVNGNKVNFTVRDENDGTAEFSGTVAGEKISGTVLMTNFISTGEHTTRTFTATRVPQYSGPPQRHEFKPTKFERQF